MSPNLVRRVIRQAVAASRTISVDTMSYQTEVTDDRGADHEEILELVGIAVVTIDANGILLEVNNAAIEMFGYSRQQLLGSNVSSLMPEPHSAKHDEYLQRHVITGESNVIGIGRKVEGLRSDGTIFPMHLAVGRFERRGEPFFTGIVHDLTDQERTHEKAVRFGQIIDDSINEIYVFGVVDLAFTLINRGALNNLGYTLDEMHRMTPLDIKPLLNRAAFQAIINPLLSGESEQVTIQTIHQRKDKSRYDVDVVLHLSNIVSPPEIVAIVQDSTERNQLTYSMHQAQKMEAIGQLTGGIAHDFNNLLTVISGNLELLDMLIEDSKSKELISEARAASSIGAKLTSQLLSFARKSSLSAEAANLNKTILNLTDLLRRSLGANISLHTVLSPELWLTKIDESLFASALMNFAINAKDAIVDRGSFTIETRNFSVEAKKTLSVGLPAGEYVQVIASDTGSGIQEEYLSAVFEPFFTSKKRGGGSGTGLGLSMVYGFAKQSGGGVTVHSEPSNGATFTLYLPRCIEGSPEVVTTDDGEPVPAVTEPGLILVVEDDLHVRRLTRQRLQHMGYQTLEAADAQAALAIYKSHQNISLLLTDMCMPDSLSGYQLARQIRAMNPALSVVIASGYSDELASRAQLSEERMVLLRKPYDMQVLADALEVALRQT